MGNEIRRSLDELVARYELEPELRDIYVEGKTDKLLLEWFLEQKRATNEALELKMEWLEKLEDCCNRNANEISFDLEKFITKYLNKNRQITQKGLFINTFEELSAKKVVDLRYKMRGHDFHEVLLWYIRPYLRKEIRNSYNSRGTFHPRSSVS